MIFFIYLIYIILMGCKSSNEIKRNKEKHLSEIYQLQTDKMLVLIDNQWKAYKSAFNEKIEELNKQNQKLADDIHSALSLGVRQSEKQLKNESDVNFLRDRFASLKEEQLRAIIPKMDCNPALNFDCSAIEKLK